MNRRPTYLYLKLIMTLGLPAFPSTTSIHMFTIMRLIREARVKTISIAYTYVHIGLILNAYIDVMNPKAHRKHSYRVERSLYEYSRFSHKFSREIYFILKLNSITQAHGKLRTRLLRYFTQAIHLALFVLERPI